MNHHRTLLLGAFIGFAALAFSSCSYDPYYSSPSRSYAYGYGGGYGGGYGDGYGYGGSNFTTSIFVRTGSPRWGYDPYARCYYDHHRRAYYDPYLSGYYPVGYRPRHVHGAPHPHHWSKGSDQIAPPSQIRDRRLDNYRDRGERYQRLGRDWSDDVRVGTQAQSQPSVYEQRAPERSAVTDRSAFTERRERMRTRTREREPAAQASVFRPDDRSAELMMRRRQAQARQEAMRMQARPPSVSRTERPASRQRAVPQRTVPQRTEMQRENRGSRERGGEPRSSNEEETARRGAR